MLNNLDSSVLSNLLIKRIICNQETVMSGLKGFIVRETQTNGLQTNEKKNVINAYKGLHL